MDGSATFTTVASSVMTKNPSTLAASARAAVVGTLPRGSATAIAVDMTRGNTSCEKRGRSRLSGSQQNLPARSALRSGVVDNRREVRDFLVSRRAKITPDKAGLALYGGNRRVPGLRRE